MPRKDFGNLEIPSDFKFSEEVIELSDDYNSRGSDSSNYNIIFSASKQCRVKTDNPFIEGTTICKICFYNEFAQKMKDVRKSRRPEFIQHQMNIRKEPNVFLVELNEFLIDNESVFNDVEYGIVREYNSIISSFNKDVNTTNESLSFTAQIANAIGNSIGEEVKIKDFTIDIFISHSSQNLNEVKQLVELIKLATNVKAEKIRCTSVPGYKLQGGSNTDEVLKKEINESKLFIAFVTEESMDSTYVLFELGARWAIDLPLIPVVQTSKDFSLFKGPLSNFHGINLSNESEIHQLIEEIGKELGIDLEPTSLYNEKINELALTIRKRPLIE